jgi:hypothetical protein
MCPNCDAAYPQWLEVVSHNSDSYWASQANLAMEVPFLSST